MAQSVIIGRVTTDLELKSSAREHPYTQFSMVEQIGYGETAHRQYVQVWAWGAMAHQLVNRGVKQGSLIWVTGSLELESYLKKDGVTRDKRLKLKLTNWDYLPMPRSEHGSTRQRVIPKHESPGAAEVIDGERSTLPE